MINILFLCVGNSSRSQMAEGIGKTILKNIATVYSAGSEPTQINPLSIEVLKEIDIDISDHYAKSVNSINSAIIDMVITLCAEEVCPVFLGNVKRVHWPLPDPANPKLSQDERLTLFRKVRDELFRRIDQLKNEIQS